MKELERVKVRRTIRVNRIKAIMELKKRALEKLAEKKKKAQLPGIPNSKKIHLSLPDAIAKKAKLEQQLTHQQTLENKTKRKRLYQQLAHLKRAIDQPDLYLVDPVQEQKRLQQDKQRRINKKLEKSKAKKKEIKKETRYKKHCLRCNSKDHVIAECPQAQSGFCFKCGSKDHTHTQCEKEAYTLAECFVCGKKGHIARQCSKNEKGLYKMGGSCFGCGSVRHTLKECPVRHGKKFHNEEEDF